MELATCLIRVKYGFATDEPYLMGLDPLRYANPRFRKSSSFIRFAYKKESSMTHPRQ